MKGEYAQRLAQEGYATLAADAAYHGTSGGEPRHTGTHHFRTEDIRGMVDYISGYPGVDDQRIGVLGICGGGGYTINAAKSDKRLKAVATLSMFNSGRVRRDGFKERVIVLRADHFDLYDKLEYLPIDKLAAFLHDNLK